MQEQLPLKAKEEEVLNFIKASIKEKGYPPSVREICKAVGFKSTCSGYQCLIRLTEKGYIEKSSLKTRALKIVEPPKEDTVSVPVVGKVAAGEPILATENIEDYFTIGESFFTKNSLKNDNFILRVQGESMINAGINNGDFIVVSKRQTARDGEIIVAMIDGEATVKTYYKEKGYIRLQPENDTMDPIISDKVEIVGKVVGLFRKIG
ncbi:MAG: repressor LexA [Clostridia bacterium]|nr:repressor LexA [Clostridia bacterium]